MAEECVKMLESLVDSLGIENTLNSLVKAMRREQMRELYDYICKNFEIPNIYEEEDNGIDNR